MGGSFFSREPRSYGVLGVFSPYSPCLLSPYLYFNFLSVRLDIRWALGVVFCFFLRSYGVLGVFILLILLFSLDLININFLSVHLILLFFF